MILIDEFSTGVDARMKRELWVIVRTIAQGKAVIITTRECPFSLDYTASF